MFAVGQMGAVGPFSEPTAKIHSTGIMSCVRMSRYLCANTDAAALARPAAQYCTRVIPAPEDMQQKTCSGTSQLTWSAAISAFEACRYTCTLKRATNASAVGYNAPSFSAGWVGQVLTARVPPGRPVIA